MFKKLSLAAFMAATPFAASADGISIFEADGGLFGNPDLSESVTLAGSAIADLAPDNAEQLSVQAGGFNVVTSTNEHLVAWCVDLSNWLRLAEGGKNNGLYTESATGNFAAVVTDNLSRLFTGFLDTVDTAAESAGFQIAIWEIVNDQEGFNLDAGNLIVVDQDTAAKDFANTYLTGLSSFDAGYDMRYFLANNKSQDLVTGDPSPVPLPASGLLLIAGLGALGWRSRKS